MAGEAPQVELPEHMRNGVFANFFSVTLNENEAIFDFGSNLPDPQVVSVSGTVSPAKNVIVARVITSAAGARKLRELLDGLLKGSSSGVPEGSSQ